MRCAVCALMVALGCSSSPAEDAQAAAESGGTPTASGGSVGSGGGVGSGGRTAAGGSAVIDASDVGASGVWRLANLTTFTSYPDPGSEECIQYNGCTWAGQFAALDGVQPESWVMAHNIIAVHSKDFPTYKLKTLRMRQGTKQIDATVYDMCADSDCDGCCTANSAETGFLIDIEKYTMERFGSGDGIVEWACLDCP